MFRTLAEKVIVGVLTAITLAAIYALWDAIREIRVGFGIPQNAVLVFDDPSGCPEGWSDMGDQWRGRMAVAAIGDSNDDYAFGRTGGAETHQLTLSEMPSHSHGYVRETEFRTKNRPSVSGQQGVTFVGVSDAETRSQGGDAPHNNMPPYVALYFCKLE